MRREYVKPLAQGQVFVPNEYVAACNITTSRSITCQTPLFVIAANSGNPPTAADCPANILSSTELSSDDFKKRIAYDENGLYYFLGAIECDRGTWSGDYQASVSATLLTGEPVTVSAAGHWHPFAINPTMTDYYTANAS